MDDTTKILDLLSTMERRIDAAEAEIAAIKRTQKGVTAQPDHVGEIANATSLGGKLAISAPPCAVDVEGVMSFADGLDWTPDAEPLGRTGLVIDGGCP